MTDLSVFRGRDYRINDGIRIRQPTIGEIEEFGEQKYFSIVKLITSTPADRKVEIWDSLHVYWEEVGEYDLFVSMFGAFSNLDMSIILPELDFTTFRTLINPNTKELALMNEDGVKIDRAIFTLITNYIRSVHQLKKNLEKGYDNFTRDMMIEDDRYDYEKAANKPFKSIILPFASYLAIRQNFAALWDIPIGTFLYEMMREQKVKEYDNLMRGIYSGCVDIKKINKSDLNWIGDI